MVIHAKCCGCCLKYADSGCRQRCKRSRISVERAAESSWKFSSQQFLKTKNYYCCYYSFTSYNKSVRTAWQKLNDREHNQLWDLFPHFVVDVASNFHHVTSTNATWIMVAQQRKMSSVLTCAGPPVTVGIVWAFQESTKLTAERRW